MTGSLLVTEKYAHISSDCNIRCFWTPRAFKNYRGLVRPFDGDVGCAVAPYVVMRFDCRAQRAATAGMGGLEITFRGLSATSDLLPPTLRGQ
jgi:hypothetical protein